MYLEQILEQLEKVRKSGKGYMARCPAHADRGPSLSITEGDDRILMHCFAGCSVNAVCEAIGIQIRDLFASTIEPHELGQLQQTRRTREQEEYQARIHEGHIIDARREAETLLRTCRGQDLSLWSDTKFDRVMKALGKAYALLREEDEENFYGRFGSTGGRV